MNKEEKNQFIVDTVAKVKLKENPEIKGNIKCIYNR